MSHTLISKLSNFVVEGKGVGDKVAMTTFLLMVGQSFVFNWECVEKEGACITIIMAYTLRPIQMYNDFSLIYHNVVCSNSFSEVVHGS